MLYIIFTYLLYFGSFSDEIKKAVPTIRNPFAGGSKHYETINYDHLKTSDAFRLGDFYRNYTLSEINRTETLVKVTELVGLSSRNITSNEFSH